MSRTRLVSVAALPLVGLLAGCGGGNSSSAAQVAVSTLPSQASTGAPGGAGAQRSFPGAVGLIATVDGSTLQVQDPQGGQEAVHLTSATRIDRTASGALRDVAVGDCVVVRADAGSSSAVVARTVQLSAAGDCMSRATAAGGAFAGGFGGGFGGGRFTGRSPGAGGQSGGSQASRSARPGGAGGETVIGKVTATSAGGFTVHGLDVRFRRGASSFSPSPAASDIAVTVTPQTAYTTTRAATAAAVKVGECATALGKADDTGAVTASTLTLSDPVNGSCRGGFRPGRGGFNSPAPSNG